MYGGNLVPCGIYIESILIILENKAFSSVKVPPRVFLAKKEAKFD